MEPERTFVLSAFVTGLSALAGLGALAAGAAFYSGTNTAGERNVAIVASVLGFVAGGVLLAISKRHLAVIGRSAAAVGALIAALAFSVPAVQSFAVAVGRSPDAPGR